MSDFLPIRRSDQPSRELSRRVETAQGDGVVAAARIQSAAYVTDIAINHATMLSMAANRAFKMSPMGEDIYQTILSSYGVCAATEIQALSLQNRVRQ